MQGLVLVVFCSLLGLSLGYLDTQMIVESQATTTAAPAKACCMPNKVEGILSEVEGFVAGRRRPRPGMAMAGIKMSYDATAKKVALDEYAAIHPGNHTMHKKIILDFPQKKFYIIRDDGSCKYVKVQKKFKKSCLPANATYIGDYYLGAGANKLNAQSWRMSVPMGHHEGFEVYVSTLKNNCLFVSEMFFGRVHNIPVMGVMSLAQATLSIKDPSVFTPPSSCTPGSLDVDNKLMEKMMERFSSD